MTIEEQIKDTEYYQYANDVVEGKIVAGKLIILACKRFISDCRRDDLIFNQNKVDKFFKFCSMFRHYKSNDCGSLGNKFKLEPWQKWVMANIIGFYYKESGKRRFNTALLCLARKNGKALSIDTKIPTPNGWTTMGELNIGDYVFGADGKPTKVTYVTDVMYNHTCYDVAFEDGDSVIADADHNWYIKHRDNGCKVMTTQELIDSKLSRVRKDGKGNEYLYRIPMNKPVEYEDKNFAVDPYILGLWLGDGHTNKPNLTVSRGDIDMYDYVTDFYGDYTIYVDKRRENTLTLRFTNNSYKGVDGGSQLRKDLETIGVLHRKHIPNEYLYGSIEQRLALIQGIMDTDGSCTESGQCEFIQKNNDIADGFCQLLSSLGIKYTRYKKIPKIKGKECNEVNRIRFYTDKTLPCFKMKRKFERLKDKLNKRMEWKTIISITPRESVPVKCITVDNEDHLYLFGERFSVTHNTALAAVIALWFQFDEQGASVALAANSRSQAQLAFDDVSKFASQIDPKQKTIRRYRNLLKADVNNSKLKVFAADSTKLDGENLSMCLIDEYHAAKDNSVYAVLRSSMTARPNPLMLVISTVGFNLQGPFKKMYDTDVEILHNLKEDDNRFIAIYQMDEGDNWENEENWIKHSPNLGVSISYDNLRKAQIEAKNNPATLNETLTKNWNIWCSVSECWIPDNIALPCFSKIDLNEFKECDCYVGVDLSSVSDMTAITYMMKKDDDKFYFHTDYYLPESCLTESPNRELYRYWVETKQLNLTPGNCIDYAYIINDMMKMYNFVNIKKIGYDTYNSTSWAIQCTELGLPLEPFSQSISNFNRPTKDFEIIVRNKNAVIDKNEITLWMLRNVDIKQDWNANSKPVKTHKDKKIDGIISMIEALGTYLNTPHYSGTIFTV